MNRAAFLSIFVILPAAFALKADTDPLTQTVQLLNELAAKIGKEGKADEKVYQEYSKWCEDTTDNLNFVIKRGVAKGNELKAIITKRSANIAALNDKIEELAASLAVDEKEFNEANGVRTREASDFAASEKELLDGIGTLGRAASIIQREMQKNPTAFAQVDTSNVDKVLKAMNAVIDAASFPVTDQKKLAALMQAQQEDSESDADALGAPAPAVYTYKTSVLDTLEVMKEKAEKHLRDLQKAEGSAKHNFEMLYASLRAQIKADTEDQNEAKAAKAASEEEKAIAEGDLAEVNKVLGNDKSTLATTSRTCTRVASDYESNTKARNEELAALATAKKILSETSSGAAAQTYSFLQLAHQSQVGSNMETGLKMNSRVDLANAEIVNLLKKLAKENHSSSLAQLASRVAATVRYGADPFTKVKQLITDMLNTLEQQAQADMTEKAYCDDEIGKSETKKTELNAQLSKLTTNMDQAAAKSAKLKAAVKDLQASIADIARSQAEIDSMRQESHNDYVTAHADLSLGLEGVRKAIGVLRDYYGGSAASASMLQGNGDFAAMMQEPAVGGPMAPELKMNREEGHLLIHAKEGEAGGKVIEILEVVESDFAKGLLEEETTEEEAVAEYKKATYSNTYSTGVKENDVKYNTKEYKSLDKSLSDLGSDRDTSTSELNAVLEYYGKIRERCIAKPETYETRSSRRESELAGLREALSILEGEAVFAQRGKKHGFHGAFLASS
jgi:hypothetical protein